MMTTYTPPINPNLKLAYDIGLFIASQVPYKDENNEGIPWATHKGHFKYGPNAYCIQMKQGLILAVENSNHKPQSIHTFYGEWMILGSNKGSFEKVFDVVQKTLKLKKIDKLSNDAISYYAIRKWNGKKLEKPIIKTKSEYVSFNVAKAVYLEFLSINANLREEAVPQTLPPLTPVKKKKEERFVRPIGFSETFSALNVSLLFEKEIIEKEKARRIEQSRISLTEIAKLKQTCSLKDAEFLNRLIENASSIFQLIGQFPLSSSAIDLKAQLISAMDNISEGIKSFTFDDNRLSIHLTRIVKPLLQKEINERYEQFLQAQTPLDDPEFHEFLSMRNDTQIQLAKEEALQKIKMLLQRPHNFFQRKDVLLCMEGNYIYRGYKSIHASLEEKWMEDFIDDLKRANIRANTITSALDETPRAHLQGAYLNGSGLPRVIVVFATDKLHKDKLQNKSCGQVEEIWNDVIEGAKRHNKKVVPIRLGSYQTFWPKGLYRHNDFQEHLLTSFPVKRKGYFTILFNDIIQQLISKEDMQEYGEIVNTFNQKIKNLKEAL